MVVVVVVVDVFVVFFVERCVLSLELCSLRNLLIIPAVLVAKETILFWLMMFLEVEVVFREAVGETEAETGAEADVDGVFEHCCFVSLQTTFRFLSAT